MDPKTIAISKECGHLDSTKFDWRGGLYGGLCWSCPQPTKLKVIDAWAGCDVRKHWWGLRR